MSRAHVQAIVDAVTAQGARCKAGQAPDGGTPYAVVYANAPTRQRPGDPSLGSLGEPFRDLEIRFQVTCVGRVDGEARLVSEKVTAALLGRVLTVAGWVCQPIWQVSDPPPIQRDDDRPDYPLFYLPVSYELRSNPA